MSKLFVACLIGATWVLAANAALAAPATKSRNFDHTVQSTDPIGRFFGMSVSPVPRTTVSYPGNHRPGTIIINTRERRLYLVLGSGQALRYGIGVGRTMAAAVEQHHDADGIVWPIAIAPFEVALVSLNPSDEAARAAADGLYEGLAAAGVEVFYDDRDERPGVKFKDADLIGFPIRVNVGGRALKDGNVEVVSRRDKQVRLVGKAEAIEAVRALRAELSGSLT